MIDNDLIELFPLFVPNYCRTSPRFPLLITTGIHSVRTSHMGGVLGGGETTKQTPARAPLHSESANQRIAQEWQSIEQ